MDWFLKTQSAGNRGQHLGLAARPRRLAGAHGGRSRARSRSLGGAVLNARSHTVATETLEIAHRGFVLTD